MPTASVKRRRRRLVPQLALREALWTNELGRDVYFATRELLTERGAPDPHDRALRCARGALLSAVERLRSQEIAERLGVSPNTIGLDRALVRDALENSFTGAFDA